MTISTTQQIDFLWKKLGYGVAKTDNGTNKDATNESVASMPFIPGDKVWGESHLIPLVIPASTSQAVTIHNDANQTTIKCNVDATSTTSRTWLTGLTNWIPASFGPTYQVKVFLADANSLTPETSGIQLFAAGSGNNDEWYFDYESGVLNFLGDNLPPVSFVGKNIFITGARYVGAKGLSTLGGLSVGTGTSGTSITSLGDITLTPASNSSVDLSGAPITNLGYSTNPTDAATTQYVIDQIEAMHSNVIYQDNSIVRLSDAQGTGATFSVTLDDTLIATMTASSVMLSNITVSNTIISSNNDLVLMPSTQSGLVVESTTAMRVPTGTTADRPVALIPGNIRYNTTNKQLEWCNGVDWVNALVHLTNQTLNGDGNTTSFVLNQFTSTNNVFVMINGVIQIPYEAYDIIGTNITFIEAPKVGDRVEVRYLTEAISAVTALDTRIVNSSDSFVVTPLGEVIDSFNILSYSTVKYVTTITTSDNNVQYAEVVVVQNGLTSVSMVTNSLSTGGNVIVTFSTSINSGQCELLASANTTGNTIKVQRFYTPV